VHVGPALGAAFTEYTAEFETAENWEKRRRSACVCAGGCDCCRSKTKQYELRARGFAYIPQGLSHRVAAKGTGRIAVIEKNYQKLDSTAAPQVIISNEDEVRSQALGGDMDLQVKCLLPDNPSFDFAVNTMTYQPGAALSMVEMHVMGTAIQIKSPP